VSSSALEGIEARIARATANLYPVALPNSLARIDYSPQPTKCRFPEALTSVRSALTHRKLINHRQAYALSIATQTLADHFCDDSFSDESEARHNNEISSYKSSNMRVVRNMSARAHSSAIGRSHSHLRLFRLTARRHDNRIKTICWHCWQVPSSSHCPLVQRQDS
jgi:hypothetical protein